MLTRKATLMALVTATVLIAGVAWAGGDPAADLSATSQTQADATPAADVAFGPESTEASAGVTLTGEAATEVTLGEQATTSIDGDVATSVTVDGQSSTSTSIDDHPVTSTTMNEDPVTSTTIDDDDDDSVTSTTIDDDDRDDSDDRDDDVDDDDLTSVVTENVLADLTKSFDVATAGTVTISVRAGALVLDSVAVNSGWSYEVDKTEDDEIEVEFHSGSKAEAEFEIRLRDGRLEISTEIGD